MRSWFIRAIGAGLICCSMAGVLPATELADIIAGAKAKYRDTASKLKDLTVIETTAIKDPRNPARIETNATTTTIYKKGDKFRIESTITATGESKESPRERTMTSIVIFDGKETWLMTPMFGITRVPRREVRQFEANSDWWNVLASSAKLAGTEAVEGRQCYVIDNTADKNAIYRRLWIDRNNYQVIRADTSGQPGKETTTLLFSDFRSIKNIIELPYRILIATNGKTSAETGVRQVQVNSGLPDRLFDPATIKAAPGTYPYKSSLGDNKAK